MGRRKKGNPVHGWICLDKSLEMTSTTAVSAVRRVFQAQKGGHAGTLDPLATGILPIALGEATKTVPFLQDADKDYRCVIRWGISTDSCDREGEVIGRSDARPNRAEVEAILPRFVGEIEQAPPQFSAILIDGQRAYDLARQGIEVEMKTRKVRIDRLEISNWIDDDHCEIFVTTGKGVYIRSLARDIAKALGLEGHVFALRRERVGGFALKDSITLEKLQEMSHTDDCSTVLLPVETALDDIPAQAITEQEAFWLKQGRPVSLLPRQVETLKAHLLPRQLGDQDVSRTVLATYEGRAVALCELRMGRLNPVRVFHLDVE